MNAFKIIHNHSGAVTRGKGWEAFGALITRHPSLAGSVAKVRGTDGLTYAHKTEMRSFTLTLAFRGRKPGSVKSIR